MGNTELGEEGGAEVRFSENIVMFQNATSIPAAL